jgi:hypothetical protein
MPKGVYFHKKGWKQLSKTKEKIGLSNKIAHNKSESLELQSQQTKEQWANPIKRKKLLDSIKKSKNTLKYRKKFSRIKKKWWKSLSVKNRKKLINVLSVSHRKENLKQTALQNYSDGQKKFFSTSEGKKLAKQKTLKLWKTKKFQKKQSLARNLKPNNVEMELQKILNKLFPKEYKYVGDFQFWIDGKNPDFINIDSKNKLIELFGDYWHKGENPKNRINHFKKSGYDTLVIWEKELKDFNSLNKKLIAFHNRKTEL